LAGAAAAGAATALNLTPSAFPGKLLKQNLILTKNGKILRRKKKTKFAA